MHILFYTNYIRQPEAKCARCGSSLPRHRHLTLYSVLVVRKFALMTPKAHYCQSCSAMFLIPAYQPPSDSRDPTSDLPYGEI